jgi:CRP-like cAMP-binding protein
MTGTIARADALAELSLFVGCSRKELHAVERLGTFVHVVAGRTLCREGEIGRECFIVLCGTASVISGGRQIATIGAGEPIGEVAVLNPELRRTATVVAGTPMDLLVLGRRELVELLHRAPSIGLRLIRIVTSRVHAAPRMGPR